MSVVRHAALLLLLPSAVWAQAGALEECRRGAEAPAQLLQCLQLAQRTASDDMLAQFQAVEQRLRQRGSEEARAAGPAALRRAQRAFEGYIEAQCGFMHDLAGGGPLGTAAALACETDLLRQRGTMLRGLLPVRPQN